MSLFRTRPFRQRRLAQKQVRACGDARKLRTRARVARDVYKRQVHIRRIREKIEINPKNPKYLKVVWRCV